MANSGAPVPPAVSTYIDSKLRNFNFAFVVSDCSKPDMPICYASSQFYELTGYTAAEVSMYSRCMHSMCTRGRVHNRHGLSRLQLCSVYLPAFCTYKLVVTSQIIGKNCRFLQGPETEKRKVFSLSRLTPHQPLGTCCDNCVGILSWSDKAHT